VIAHHENGLRSQRPRQPLTLGLIEGEAVVVALVGDVIVEAQRTLPRHFQARILQHAQGRRVRHVGMQRTARLRRQLVHRQVYVERRVLDRAVAAQRVAVEIDHHEIAGPHLRPIQPERREEEPVE
jgi:hypothetical protein